MTSRLGGCKRLLKTVDRFITFFPVRVVLVFYVYLQVPRVVRTEITVCKFAWKRAFPERVRVVNL